MRTLVDLADGQIQALDELSKQDKQSRAALIRQAIDDYLAKRHSKQEGDAFGLWGNLKARRLGLSGESASRMVKALFDTSILVDYLNAVPEARTELQRYTEKAVSIITWMEVPRLAPIMILKPRRAVF